MTAGDIPRFSPGIHTPAEALNDLARRVGMLEALRAAPPLQLQTTPAGGLLSLVETAEGAAPTLDVFSQALSSSTNFGFGSGGPPSVNLATFTLATAGTYLLFFAAANRVSNSTGVNTFQSFASVLSVQDTLVGNPTSAVFNNNFPSGASLSFPSLRTIPPGADVAFTSMPSCFVKTRRAGTVIQPTLSSALFSAGAGYGESFGPVQLTGVQLS